MNLTEGGRIVGWRRPPPGLEGHSRMQEQHVQRPGDRKILGIFKEQKEG